MSLTHTSTANIEKKIKRKERLYRIKYFRNPDDWSMG